MDDSVNDSEDDFQMSFTPRQAQTCGGQSIFFSFSGKKSPIRENRLYYIIFEGSELRHITSAKVINPYTLQAVIPEHNLSESAMMSVCHSRDGVPVVLAADKFSFTLDSTYLLAQSLAMNSLNSVALIQLEGLYQNFLNAETEELKVMDHRLTASFKQLNLPSSWRLAPPLGEDVNGNPAGWSLLHFCAKFDLLKLAEYLIERTGAAEAIQLMSPDGLTPLDIARTLGNEAVMEVLTRVPSEDKISDKSSMKATCPSVKGHKLGTTTITNCNTGGQLALEEDVRLLEELNSLARETKKSKIKRESLSDEDDADSENESGPLATSLLKLKKINQEIQRLRDLASENRHERKQRTSSCPDSMRFYQTGIENGYSDESAMTKTDNTNGLLPTLSEDELEEADSCPERNGTSRSTPNVSTTSIDDEAEDDDVETTLKPDEAGVDETDDDELEGHTGAVCQEDEEDAVHAGKEEVESAEKDASEERQVECEEATDVANEKTGDDGEANVEDEKVIDEEEKEEDEEKADVEAAEAKCIEDTKDEEDVVENVGGSEAMDLRDEIVDHVEEEVVEEDTDRAEKDDLKDDQQVTEKQKVEKGQMSESESDSSGDEKDIEEGNEGDGENEANEGADENETRLASVAEETEEELEQVELDKEQIRRRVAEANKREEEERETVGAQDMYKQRSISSGSGVDRDEICNDSRKLRETKSAGTVSALRKERPLSDSLENLRSVEKDVNILSLTGQKARAGFGFLNKFKSRSLDALFTSSDKEKSSSAMKTSSQLSLNRSNDSLLSEPDSPETTRSDSVSRDSRHSHETSQLSLNDVCFSFSSQEDETVAERKGFPFRFNFKKAKSLTSLEMKRNKMQEEEDDRRKTIMGGICTDKVSMRRTQEMENYAERNQPITYEDTHLGTFVLARYNTQNAEDKSSNELVVTVQPPKTDRIRSTSDVGAPKSTLDSESDTDEGTSTVIESKEKDKKGDKDRRFNILRSKTKKKVKEKDKEKKEKEVDKASKEKVLKKGHKGNNTNKGEGKSSFLTKRGASFRQSLRGVPSPLPSQQDQKMFQRASSIGPTSSTAVRHSASLNTLGAGNRSPTSSRRTTVHDIDGQMEAESLPDLSALRQQGSSRTSLDLDSNYDEDFQDGHLVDYLAEYDSDLDLKDDEPETWSELVDRKVQRKMHAKDIKRQDVIYELILTESNYVRTLNIMYKIYYCGIVREMHLDTNKIDLMFPRLEDLLDINGKFLADLKARQQNSDNKVIESIGDILVEWWGGEKGEFMKEVYGYFCSRHLQAVALYKDLLKTDKNFANFIKDCMLKPRVRRLSIPECITLVTQRLTKYPLLIEAIIKATKESKSDYNNLKKSLKGIKQILTGVDDCVREYEKEKRLEEIKKRLDPKGEVQLKTSKKIYKAMKLFPKRSKLIFDGTMTWRGKSKSVETMAVLLSTRLVLLQEKDNSKYTVLSVDQKSPVVILKNMMVREVATDSRALFLVSTSAEGPDIYEMVFASSRERKSWMELFSTAIKNCPEEDEENPSDQEEEYRKEEESKTARLKEIVEQLNQLNVQISALIAEKNKVVSEMREVVEKMDSTSGKPLVGVEIKQIDVLNARETLDGALNEASVLMNLITGVESPVFSPSPSPTTPNINASTKRAETFGGFDARPPLKQPPAGGSVGRASSMRHELKTNSKSAGTLDVDSALNNKDPRGIRRPSQGGMLLSVLGRTKTMGSQEDLTSLSTSNSSVVSTTVLTPQLLSLSQLKDSLASLVEVTNKQDLEVASVRLALQEARHELCKCQSERAELEEKLASQQKEHEKLMSRQQEHYLKLQREFKRTIEKMQRQFSEQKAADHSGDVQRYLQGSASNMKSSTSGKNKHSKHKSTSDRSNTPPVGHGDDTIETQKVIYF